jgi:uncharacterized protein (AIM24 family)
MTVKHRTVGTASQLLTCQLEPGQSVYAEPGKFLWKTTNVALETRLTKPSTESGAGGGGGGDAGDGGAAPSAGASFLKKAMDVGKRVVAGESLALQYFTAQGGAGLVSFSGLLPGEVRALELDGTSGWMCERSTLIAAETTANFDIAFSGWKAARSGGLGFVLERYTGTGTVFVAAAGSFESINPAKYGGKVQVDTGTVVAFQDTLRYGVELIGGISGQTLMAGLFGGEGVHLATLEGDGEVLLQSTTVESLARVLRHDPRPADERKGALGGIF